MPLDPKFTKFTTVSPIIISYSFTEIADGTGIAHLKGASGKLTTADLFSGPELSAESSSTSSTQIIDHNFDLSPFNLPRTMKGTATVNFCYAFSGTGTGKNITLKFKFRKVELDSNVVEIAEWTQTFSNTSNRVSVGFRDITIPKTYFQKGETLRITFEGWMTVIDSGTFRITLGIDPQDRDGTYIVPSTDTPKSTTKLDFYIPFEIQE